MRQALHRTGRFDPESLPEVRVTKSPAGLAYRSRVRLHVKDGTIGYFSPRSRALVEFDRCAVASGQLSTAIALLRRELQAHPGAARTLRTVELRALALSSDDVERRTCSVHLIPRERASPDLWTPLVRALAPHMLVRVGGEEATFQELSGGRDGQISVWAPPGGFTQVNLEVNRLLVGSVLDVAEGIGARQFLDVYCGSGNFSLPLLELGLSGVGIEQNEEAVRAARRGALPHWGQGEFFAGRAEAVLQHHKIRHRNFDFVVVDPPRAGAKPVLQPLLEMNVPSFAMVSCDPVTLARDLRVLCDGGYSLRSLALFDMFPQTHHFESLAVLHRSLPDGLN